MSKIIKLFPPLQEESVIETRIKLDKEKNIGALLGFIVFLFLTISVISMIIAYLLLTSEQNTGFAKIGAGVSLSSIFIVYLILLLNGFEQIGQIFCHLTVIELLALVTAVVFLFVKSIFLPKQISI
jgi:hypothetical protein